jgi:CMP-N-acetylneuraminic acid synthetase
LTTVAYVTRPDFIRSNNAIWDGRVVGVEIPNERAIDIDTEFDFKIADYLMRERMTEGER